jgi:hypothetical protein
MQNYLVDRQRHGQRGTVACCDGEFMVLALSDRLLTQGLALTER